MRVIILNMIIFGVMSSLVENDVFARDVGPTNLVDRIKLPQSGNLVGKEDFSDSFDQLFLSNEINSDKKKSNLDKTNDLSQSQNTNVAYGGAAQLNSPQSHVEGTESALLRHPTQKNDVNMHPQSPAQAGSANELQLLPLSSLPPQDQKDNKDTTSLDTKVQPDSPQSHVEGTESSLSSPSDQGGKAVSPPPPPAMMGDTNVPPPVPGGRAIPLPPPPPPSLMIMKPAVPTEVTASNVLKGLREDLRGFLNSNGVATMAGIVNLYLQGNKEKISEGVHIANRAAANLIKRLDGDLSKLNTISENHPIIKEFNDILKPLRDYLQTIKEFNNITEPLKDYSEKLTKQSYYANNFDLQKLIEQSDHENNFSKSEFFEEISEKINDIAYKYFSKVMDSGKDLKSVEDLTALKDADIIIERAVVLANSFSNLMNLSEKQKIEAFSENVTRDALEIINLKALIFKRLGEIASTSSNNSAKLPTADVISEQKLLEKALACINATCRGDNQLQVLLDMRDILNNPHTIITSNEQAVNQDPLTIIHQLNDRIAKDYVPKDNLTKDDAMKERIKEIGVLLVETDKESQDIKYSQFGKMFTEGDKKYGGALIPSVNQWIKSENFAIFDGGKIRNAFNLKTLTGDVVGEYIKLLTDDIDSCRPFAEAVIRKMITQVKFKVSSYTSTSQKTETKKEDQKVLVEVTNGETKLGTSSDPNKIQNMIPFSILRKNCEEYVEKMSHMDKDIKEIPEKLEKIKEIFSLEPDNKRFANYINNILNKYFVFRDFITSDDRITFGVVNVKKGLLTEKDVPNVVFALAQNCNLAVKQPALPLFPSSKDTDNIWVFKMSWDLLATTSKIINAILKTYAEIFSGKTEIKGTEVGEIVGKLDNLRKSLETVIYQNEVLENVVQGINISVSKAKADAEAEEKKPAEKINEVKLRKITEQIQNLSRLADDLPKTYAENNISKLTKIKEDIEEVISSVQTASDIKNKAKLSQKPNRRDTRFIR